ncbi:MAG: helix-turn-helix transcriptional regulator [Phycisphaerae bacterium]
MALIAYVEDANVPLTHAWADHIAATLNKRLRERKLTGNELATKLEVHRNTVSRLRRGKHASRMTIGMLRRLSNEIDVPISEWFPLSAGELLLGREVGPSTEAKLQRMRRYLRNAPEDRMERILGFIEWLCKFRDTSGPPSGDGPSGYPRRDLTPAVGSR